MKGINQKRIFPLRLIICVYMGLFDDRNNKRKGQQDYGVLSYMMDEQDNDNDEEIDNYGLEDWEKEEVKKGNQDVWNFEEEDLEDDDYYSDDDE